METTFGCKTPTFAHIWLLQKKNSLKHMGCCWYHDMDPIEHDLDDFGLAIINRDNLPLTLHELAQLLTQDSDALDIATIGSDSGQCSATSWCPCSARGGHTWFWWQSGIRNSTIENFDAVKSPKTELSLKLTEVEILWQNPQFCCSSGSFSF